MGGDESGTDPVAPSGGCVALPLAGGEASGGGEPLLAGGLADGDGAEEQAEAEEEGEEEAAIEVGVDGGSSEAGAEAGVRECVAEAGDDCECAGDGVDEAGAVAADGVEGEAAASYSDLSCMTVPLPFRSSFINTKQPCTTKSESSVTHAATNPLRYKYAICASASYGATMNCTFRTRRAYVQGAGDSKVEGGAAERAQGTIRWGAGILASSFGSFQR